MEAEQTHIICGAAKMIVWCGGCPCWTAGLHHHSYCERRLTIFVLNIDENLNNGYEHT